MPLYVNFGTESFRDGVDLTGERVLRAPALLARAADDVPADAGRLPRRLHGALRLRAHPLAPPCGQPVGDIPERRHRRRRARRRPRAHDRHRDRVRRDLAARAGDPAPTRAGTTDEEIDALVERYKAEHGLLFTVDTLEFLATRRPHRTREGVRRRAAARQADPVDSPRRSDPGQARARRSQGIPGVHRRRRLGRRRRAGAARRHRARRRARTSGRAREDVRDLRPQAQIDIETMLGAVLGAHAGPGTVGFFWFTDG